MATPIGYSRHRFTVVDVRDGEARAFGVNYNEAVGRLYRNQPYGVAPAVNVFEVQTRLREDGTFRVGDLLAYFIND